MAELLALLECYQENSALIHSASAEPFVGVCAAATPSTSAAHLLFLSCLYVVSAKVCGVLNTMKSTHTQNFSV